jgi:hypothetical protein
MKYSLRKYIGTCSIACVLIIANPVYGSTSYITEDTVTISKDESNKLSTQQYLINKTIYKKWNKIDSGENYRNLFPISIRQFNHKLPELPLLYDFRSMHLNSIPTGIFHINKRAYHHHTIPFVIYKLSF